MNDTIKTMAFEKGFESVASTGVDPAWLFGGMAIGIVALAVIFVMLSVRLRMKVGRFHNLPLTTQIEKYLDVYDYAPTDGKTLAEKMKAAGYPLDAEFRGNPLLLEALRTRTHRFAKHLLRAGADANRRNEDSGMSGYFYARKTSAGTKLLTEFLRAGADPDAVPFGYHEYPDVKEAYDRGEFDHAYALYQFRSGKANQLV